ncbi:hypothetical protein QVD17_05470 [Tagetes erecta]|uniref:Uncharacterized protein n=1 Tax=Tagetes erecta TaxID=13708 RepID=A0AAD8P5I2_TARER|nr:hypothetical protein QVD17_05470 [Tagetes erecta]
MLSLLHSQPPLITTTHHRISGVTPTNHRFITIKSSIENNSKPKPKISSSNSNPRNTSWISADWLTGFFRSISFTQTDDSNIPIANAQLDDVSDLFGGALFLPLFKWMNDYVPIYRLAAGPRNFVIANDPVLRNYGSIYAKGLVAEVSEFLFGSGFAFAEGSLWTKQQQLQVKAEASLGGRGELREEEDSKFVPLSTDDPATFGPPALLLVGFQLHEAVQIQKFLKDLDGQFLQVIFCTQDMMTASLWEAINTKQPNLQSSKVAGSLPRICFFSGLTAEEMIMFIDAFPQSGLEGAVFAAVVPNSADKPLLEVIEEIMGDHEMMKSREST